MQFTFRPIRREDVKKIATWRYEKPYEQYNGDMLAFSLFVFIALRPLFIMLGEENFAVDNQQGDLVGFFQFIKHFRRRVTIGLGLRPDLTGQGHGLAFVKAGLAFGEGRYNPQSFNLLVRALNQRAFKVYSRAGFQRVKETTSLTSRGLEANYKMRRDVSFDA